MTDKDRWFNEELAGCKGRKPIRRQNRKMESKMGKDGWAMDGDSDSQREQNSGEARRESAKIWIQINTPKPVVERGSRLLAVLTRTPANHGLCHGHRHHWRRAEAVISEVNCNCKCSWAGMRVDTNSISSTGNKVFYCFSDWLWHSASHDTSDCGPESEQASKWMDWDSKRSGKNTFL